MRARPRTTACDALQPVGVGVLAAAATLKELVPAAGGGRLLEHTARTPAQVAEIHLPRLGLLYEALREVERTFEQLTSGGGVQPHLEQNRPLRTRGDNRLGDPFDP